jgi:hypothetical protein
VCLLIIVSSTAWAGWRQDCRHELQAALQAARSAAKVCRKDHGTSTTTTTITTTTNPVTNDPYDSQNCRVPGIAYQGQQYLRVEHPFGDLRQCSPFLATAGPAPDAPAGCVWLSNAFIYGALYCPASPSGAFVAP